MKILIAYDRSECAETALEDLKRAGLPGDVDVLVMSIADIFLPPPDDEVETTAYVPEAVKQARERAQGQLEEAAAAAKHASEQIGSLFPGWQVRSEALADSPAWALIRTWARVAIQSSAADSSSAASRSEFFTKRNVQFESHAQVQRMRMTLCGS
jgi:nucleotide-binding universal stress UspA family protein